jgi:uncharacterized protein
VRRLTLLALPLLLVALAAPAHAEGYPEPDGFVVDTAGVVPAAVEATLERELSSYSRRTTNQVAVLVIRSLDGQTVEDYATALFNAWGIGQADKDNGVLVLVAVDDHRDRIEVGSGLESVLTDEKAQQVLDEVMQPSLRAGNYAGAVQKGERAVRAVLGDRSVATAAPAAGDPFQGGRAPATQDAPVDEPAAETDNGPSAGGVVAPAAVVGGILLVSALFFRGRGGGGGRGGFLGGLGGGVGGSGWTGGSGGFSGGGGGAGGGSGFGGGSSSGGGSSGSW